VVPVGVFCVSGESYTSECLPTSVGAQVCELFIGLSSSDNSAAAVARTSRKYGHRNSSGLLASLWVESWVHPEDYSGLNRRANRSLINELLLSYTCNWEQFTPPTDKTTSNFRPASSSVSGKSSDSRQHSKRPALTETFLSVQDLVAFISSGENPRCLLRRLQRGPVQSLVAFPTKRDQVGLCVFTQGTAPSHMMNVQVF
jgi:hypothetical protein